MEKEEKDPKVEAKAKEEEKAARDHQVAAGVAEVIINVPVRLPERKRQGQTGMV